jgi:membrane-anchored protein YejM (alkaline phosphatase superfamily)
MMLHKQYVEPFAKQNSLAKLITAEEYTPFVSVDSILKVILPASLPRLVELDRGRATKDYNLCGSLAELRSQLTAAPSERMFAYTQAQDIHISTIARENKSVVSGGDYSGLDAPYASRIARFDACFGTFIDALKAAGLYDNSIVVFAADHGDSLGEEGRFGHAYTVFPEVMRIPLIIKVPGDQSRLAANRDALVFSADITPTLYDLLGHKPSLRGFPFGQSLAAPLERASGELVASSYGAVYGWLSQGGKRLYIADSVNFQDYVYEISGSAATRATADAAERTASRKSIREAVDAIAKTYHFTPR